MTPDIKIYTRALLVALNLSTWTARRYDKTITNKVNRDLQASADAGRYNKMLLPGDAPSYKALMTLAGTIRTEHYARTLAWSDEGWRLLCTDNYMQYVDWYRKRSNDWDNAIDAFVVDYPDLRNRARILLNGAYCDEDYPRTGEDVRAKFGMSQSFLPLPAAGDVRLDLTDYQVSMIEASVQSRVQSAMDNAVQDAWTRLHDVVSKMSERLNDPDAKLFDTLITNTRDTADMLARLNPTRNAELESMRARVERELTRYDMQTLRDNPRTRAAVASAADSILDAMRQNGMAV